jgi:hypothetical protein
MIAVFETSPFVNNAMRLLQPPLVLSPPWSISSPIGPSDRPNAQFETQAQQGIALRSLERCDGKAGNSAAETSTARLRVRPSCLVTPALVAQEPRTTAPNPQRALSLRMFIVDVSGRGALDATSRSSSAGHSNRSLAGTLGSVVVAWQSDPLFELLSR